MFDVRFLPPQPDTTDFRQGRITLGDYLEHFESPTCHWPVARYERQWLEAARRLIAGAPTTALRMPQNER